MSWLRSIRLQIRALFRNGRHQDDLDEEMQAHLEQLVDDFKEEGLSEEEARKLALREFGGVEKFKEETRDSWGTRVVMDLIRDLRYSARSLWKSKGFSFAVIGTLAICLGANTTILSVLYELVLRPLPFENPDRVVHVYNEFREPEEHFRGSGTGLNQYLDYRNEADLFEDVSVELPITKTFQGKEIFGRQVTSDYFDVLKVKPLLGRFIIESEVFPESSNVLVLSQTAWEDLFDSDPGIIGKEVAFLDEITRTIIGVAPRSLEVFDSRVRFFVPFVFRKQDYDPVRRIGYVRRNMWGRLKQGVTDEQAKQQLESLEYRWYNTVLSAEDQARWNPERRVGVRRDNLLKGRLLLLQVGALMVLLVGCVNIANLLLGRAGKRAQELCLRLSFGAGKLALGRLLITESFLLAGIGMTVGCVFAWSVLKLISNYLVVLLPQAPAMHLNSQVSLVTMAIAGILTLIMGLIPITMMMKSGALTALSSGGSRTASADRKTRRLSGMLVVAQMALALILLVGSGLMFRSFYNVLQVDPGFDAEKIVRGAVKLRPLFKTDAERKQVKRLFLEKMNEIPGVERVALQFSNLNILGEHNLDPINLRGVGPDGEHLEVEAIFKRVTSDFFATMGMTVLDGRAFDPVEKDEGYILDQSILKYYPAGAKVVGSDVCWGRIPNAGEVWPKAIGIVNRANFEGLEKRDGMPIVYRSEGKWADDEWEVYLRTTRDPEMVVRDMQTKMHEIHPAFYLGDPTTLKTPLKNLYLDRQGITLIICLFAGVAVLLSAIGIYGVLSYDVQQRQREMGIRSAIGASRSDVLNLILGQGMKKVAVGLAIGLAGSLYLTRFLESRLFDVSPLDATSFGLALLFLLGISFLASFVPARRAVRVQPVEALRVE